MRYLTNAFSLSMLPTSLTEGVIKFRRLNLDEVRELLKGEFISAIGHESTAKLLSDLLQIQVPVNRIQISLQEGDEVIVVQLLIRLGEGQVLSLEEIKKLYEEGKIAFYKISL